jgi:hypothetical protein
MNARKWMWFGGLWIGLGLAVPVHAQRDASSFFTGVHPSDVTYKPVDLSKTIAPVPQQNTDKFSFRRYLSKVIPGLSPTPPSQTTAMPSVPTVSGATALPAMKPIGPLVAPTMPKR